MNTTLNVSLQVVATGLIALGATSITTTLWPGVIEIVLGVAVYIAYELTPVSVPPAK